MLLSLDCQRRPVTGDQSAAVALDEFKEPVCESKFTKWPAGMSFVNASNRPQPPPKYHNLKAAAAG
jgi:hypothetical protein